VAKFSPEMLYSSKVKLCFLQFSKPKELSILFFFFFFPPPQCSIYRKFPKCFKALVGDMFVRDFQLGENCHKTKSVSKCGKIFTKNIMFILKTLVNFLYKQGI
jgi:hypothetical protein